MKRSEIMERMELKHRDLHFLSVSVFHFITKPFDVVSTYLQLLFQVLMVTTFTIRYIFGGFTSGLSNVATLCLEGSATLGLTTLVCSMIATLVPRPAIRYVLSSYSTLYKV